MPGKSKAIQLACILACSASSALSQPPAFEVASIKPSDPATNVAIRRSGYRFATVNTSLLFLISWAYDIERDHIYGQPKWLDSVHYDIVANEPQDGKPSPPRMPGRPGDLQQMMQALLAERFRLAVHTETRDRPIYALVVAKGGPKIRLTEAPDQFGQNPFSQPGLGRLLGNQVSADMLAKVLSGLLARTVEDQTGLQGVFDFKLEWEPERPPVAPNNALPSAPLRAGSSLFTALQEQLGLKLEARKGQTEVLVIDHVESAPTAN